MTESHGVARDQLRAFIERIERLEEEKKSIADDIKDVYGEAKGTGFDTKILREVIKIRKQDRDERAEREAILDSYLIALGMIEQPSFFDDEPVQSAPATRQPAMPLRSDGGLSILTKHEDIRTAPVTAEEASDGTPADRPSLTTREAEESVVLNSEMDRATEGSFETGSEAAENARKAITVQGSTSPEDGSVNHAGAGESPATDITIPSADGDAAANAGGTDVDGGALRANRDENGEGAASALPAKPKHRLRPNCLDRSNCKSGTVDHCWSCRRAMQKSEEMA